MKKIFVAAVVMLLAMGSVNAQNTFRGIVKYKLTSSGKVDVKIPAENSEVEVKVYDNKIMLGNNIQNGFKLSVTMDLSQAIAYLAANDIELESYTGDGKLLIRDETTKAEIDSIEIPDKEPGHYYYEYLDETQEMLGFTAKKMVMHRYDEEGVDNPTTCWYTTEIGPEYCLLIGNIKGMPLVFTSEQGEGKAITYTATEIVKGKVKEAEMLLPAGFTDTSEEEFTQIMKELQDAFELLEE